MIGRKMDDLLTITENDLTKDAVDCGTCPVSMACAVGEGGNGWRFPCCGATSVALDEDANENLIVDCGNNGFDKRYAAATLKCPLCSGDMTDAILRGNSGKYRYLRTVHSQVPPKQRLQVLQDRVPDTKERIRQDRERVKKAARCHDTAGKSTQP
jgi:hypothetical protein